MLVTLIAINLLAAAAIGAPLAALNLVCAGFLAGLWAAEVISRRIAGAAGPRCAPASRSAAQW